MLAIIICGWDLYASEMKGLINEIVYMYMYLLGRQPISMQNCKCYGFGGGGGYFNITGTCTHRFAIMYIYIRTCVGMACIIMK